MNRRRSTISLQRSARCRPTGSVGVVRMGGKRGACPAILCAAFLVVSTTAFAATLVTSSVDGGGKRSTSASYTMDGSLGGIGGISSVVSPPETVKHGYIGQLYDVVSVSVAGTPASVNETSTSQLSGTATMDDATVAALTGSDVSWNVPALPIASINGSGLATASAVYQDTSGPFSGGYLGVLGSGSLLVLNSNPDNYGIYANDNIPDSVQVQYFGLDNPNGVASADADGTGQNNLFKYVAGLDPTNPASIFVLKIASVPGQPSQKKLTFLPWASGRTYTPEFRTDLTAGSYATLLGYSGPTTNSTEISVTDVDATQPNKFYRIRISLP